ncbi:hypothetical protein CHS0354_029339 [Potamilus streckersoni]|uniref:glucose-6-phosphate 1-epimerase n=1 Tax=Potamilus streckersoni TaxID=2493646 RepID=A0AAE0W5R2_9BIVA|nr:hypothetical protein CHS0354_029339 [Potamilus streckersoni]
MAGMESEQYATEDIVELDYGNGTAAVVHLHGATVVSWKFQGEEILFCSKKAIFDNKKAIRGGIPLVFPQFGPWSLGPQHGFARIRRWKLVSTPMQDSRGNITAVFSLEDDKRTRELWDKKFELVYTVCLWKTSLELNLKVLNRDESSFEFTTLMHTYFTTPDVTKTSVIGLKDLQFIDKVQDGALMTENRGAVFVNENYDRVYQNAPNEIVVNKVGTGKTKVIIKKTNFPDVVVWNPWEEKAQGMADFDEKEYKTMLCVEVGSVFNQVTLGPGEQKEFSQIISVAPAE